MLLKLLLLKLLLLLLLNSCRSAPNPPAVMLMLLQLLVLKRRAAAVAAVAAVAVRWGATAPVIAARARACCWADPLSAAATPRASLRKLLIGACRGAGVGWGRA